MFFFLYRQNYKVNNNTVVCSNHFEYGQPRRTSLHPTKYLTGYNNTGTQGISSKHRDTAEHGTVPSRRKRLRDAIAIATSPTVETCKASFQNDHGKYTNIEVHAGGESCRRTCPVPQPCASCETLFQKLRRRNAELQKQLQDLREEKIRIDSQEQQRNHPDLMKGSTVADIQSNDNLMKLYSGMNSYCIVPTGYCGQTIHIEISNETLLPFINSSRD